MFRRVLRDGSNIFSSIFDYAVTYVIIILIIYMYGILQVERILPLS